MLIARRNSMVVGGISAKSYIQDGLVAMWDGIENAGWGMHNPNATVWKDLTGNNHDLTLYENAMTWLDNAITGKPTAVSPYYWAEGLSNSGGIAKAYTMEFCIEIQPTTQFCIGCCFGKNLSGRRPLFFTIDGQRINIDSTNGTTLYGPPVTNGYVGTINVHYIESTSGTGAKADSVYSNGQQYTYSRNQAGSDVSYYPYPRVGGRGHSGSYMTNRLKFHRIALYSHALTADEIAANNAMDKARFNLT